jgi:tetratricopeptide (TPR) repeat protein
MFRQIRFLCVALIVPIIASSSHVAQAQWYGGRGYGSRIGFFDSGIGAFGGGTYPGAAFGYHPRYLASRAFTAGGVAGSLTYGTPQPAATEAPQITACLARAATPTCGSPEDKVLIGETAFRRGDYLGAIEDWKIALAAGSRNPVLVMLLGQAYFAAGNYQESAVTTQAAMHALPQDRWGIVVSNRSELYSNPSSYIFQLQQLESAVHENPKDPAQRFLLAYHYAYLGYPQPAVVQLDKVVELEPRDEIAAQLRNVMAPRLPAPGAPVITPGVVTPARNR